MAFRVFSCRLPEEYIEAIKELAGEEEESRGFLLQQALYRSWDGKLPPPRHRDNEPDAKRKTQEIRT